VVTLCPTNGGKFKKGEMLIWWGSARLDTRAWWIVQAGHAQLAWKTRSSWPSEPV
jgi:hypothetical protein